MEVRSCCGAADQDDEVEFREAVVASIPLLLKPLGSQDMSTQRMTLELIDKLANRGE